MMVLLVGDHFAGVLSGVLRGCGRQTVGVAVK
jgi:hypothetical protein